MYPVPDCNYNKCDIWKIQRNVSERIREEEQKKRDRFKKTNNKKNEDDSEKVDDNSQWLKKISLSYIHTILKN